MIRDMDLLRQIVLTIERLTETTNSHLLRVEGYEQDEIAYHCLLLHDAGLIEIAGDPFPPPRGKTHKRLEIERLTMDGHDFREQIKDKDKWSTAKSIMSSIKQFTMEALRMNLIRMTNEGWDERMGEISKWVSQNL